MDKQQLLDLSVPVLGGVLAFLFLFLSLRAGRRQRLVSDLPTSKTTGVFIGLVELKGTAEVEDPLVSYLAASRCVYFRWHVDEHWTRIVTETYTDSEGKTQTRTRIESGWTTVAQGGDDIAFYLRDDCGVIRILPEKAAVEPRTVFDQTCGPGDALYYGKGPPGAVANSDHRRRFVEQAIPLHADLFVVGHARERADIVAPEIAYDPHTEMYLISTRTEDQVRRGLAWQFWLIGLLGVPFSVAGFLVADQAAHRPAEPQILKYALVGSLFALAWFCGWFFMVYNSLVALRQRVEQAWSNVDVQLKRRHDLIPALVDVVKGMRDYEQNLQVELAHLRAQQGATAPGEPGPDPQAAAGTVAAILERYPELKANSSFLHLQETLIETEQRAALARSYFNAIASFYNFRLQRIPDRFIAALAAMKRRELLTADEFERAPVEVKLAA